MAITSAQLASAITASQVTFAIQNVVAPAAGSGFPVVGALPLPYGSPLLIDSEFMFVVSQPATNTITVRSRGADGSVAASHDILANIYTSPVAGDFPLPVPGTMVTSDLNQDNAISMGQDGTVLAPQGNTVVNINKATAAALTLTAPSLSINAVTLKFTSNTAAAHVVTATGLLQDGTATPPKNTLTFAAQKGASVELVAENGLWNVQALQNVTVA